MRLCGSDLFRVRIRNIIRPFRHRLRPVNTIKTNNVRLYNKSTNTISPLLRRVHLAKSVILPRHYGRRRNIFRQSNNILRHIPSRSQQYVQHSLPFRPGSLILHPIFTTQGLRRTTPINVLPHHSSQVNRRRNVQLPTTIYHLTKTIRRHAKRHRIPTHQGTTSDSPIQRSTPAFYILPRRPSNHTRLTRQLIVPYPLTRAMNRRNNIVPYHYGLRHRQINLTNASIFMPTTKRRRRRQATRHIQRNQDQTTRVGFRLPSAEGHARFGLRQDRSFPALSKLLW